MCVYCIFGSGKLQPWAKRSREEKEKSIHDIQYCIRNPVKFLQTDNSTEVDGYDSTV